MEIYNSRAQQFGLKEFYQSCDILKIKGKRNTSFRWKEYDLEDFLNENDKVLDIGCNVGAISFLIAKKVELVHGIDNNKSVIKIANLIRDELNIKNCIFMKEDFAKFQPKIKYNVILSLAVNHWTKMPLKDYINKIKKY